DGPTVGDGVGFGVDGDELSLVFEVVVDHAGGWVGSAKFWFAAERNSGDDFGVGDVDDAGGVAAAIEDVGFVCARIVEHAVGVLFGVDLGDDLKGVEIDNGGFVFPAAGDDAAQEVVGNGEAVNSLGIGNLTHDFIVVNVDDDNFRPVADVEAAGGGINGAVVPAAVAGDGNLGEEGVGNIGARAGGGEQEGGADENS